MLYHDQCRWFTGYKPCHFKRPCESCPHFELATPRIAIISLAAMGAVIRSTCLLPALKRQYPRAHISWITLPACLPLLAHNPYIDRVISLEAANLPALEYLQFDLLLAVDKSLEAGALAESMQAKEKRGFGLSPQGSIRPFNSEAHYQYDLGLNDELKFYHNQKPETQQITESLGLKWERDPYVLSLTPAEESLVGERRQKLLSAGNTQAPQAKGVIGYNTGCSLLFPYKKLTLTRAIETIHMWRQAFPHYAVALLGGREDRERQEAMKAAFAHDPGVINTPCDEGLRSGMLWIAASDLVFTGCSLGMHIAIALQKLVVAWFGVSCIQEIDLYERGIKLQAEVGCSPCWQKSCTQDPKCFDQVPVARIQEATARLLSSQR